MNDVDEKNVMSMIFICTSFVHHINPNWKGDGM